MAASLGAGSFSNLDADNLQSKVATCRLSGPKSWIELTELGLRNPCTTSYGACGLIKERRGNIYRAVYENAGPKSEVQIWVRSPT